MQIKENIELQREVLRVLVQLTKKTDDPHVYRSSTSIAKRTNYNGSQLYSYYVPRLLSPYIEKGLVEWVFTPSETGGKGYVGYRANLRRRREIERELRSAQSSA